MGNEKRSMNRADNGFLLVTSLTITVFLTLGSATLLVNSISQSNASLRLYNRSNSLQLAEAGINQAGLNLRTTTTSDDTLTANLTSGSFVINTQQSLGNNLYQVQSTGTSGTETRTLEGFYRATFSSVFQFAVFGDELVELSGGMETDSFDSRNGEYDEDDNKSNQGDIGTNSIISGGMSMDGNSLFVDGQLMLGPGVSNPSTYVDGYDGSQISGGDSGTDVVSMPNTMPMTPVVVPAGVTCTDLALAANTTLDLYSNGGPLGNGTYCYEDLTIGGSSAVAPHGDVKVYLTGTLNVAGNTDVGNPNDPTELIFYMTANSISTIEGSLLGTSKFYGGIYAPEATIAIGGNTEIFGAIAANRIHVTGSALVHYDEAMADLTTEPGSYTTELTAWQEL